MTHSFDSRISKASKRPWIVREHPADTDRFIIQAPKNKPTDPYNIEVMGEDAHPDLYPIEQKRGDAQLIVEAANAMSGDYGWLVFNEGPCIWFWVPTFEQTVHELSDDVRPATVFEKVFFERCGQPTPGGGFELVNTEIIEALN